MTGRRFVVLRPIESYFCKKRKAKAPDEAPIFAFVMEFVGFEPSHSSDKAHQRLNEARNQGKYGVVLSMWGKLAAVDTSSTVATMAFDLIEEKTLWQFNFSGGCKLLEASRDPFREIHVVARRPCSRRTYSGPSPW